jgi:hypothetical protein
VSHLGFGQGFHRLNEIVANRLGKGVFEPAVANPSGSQSRAAGFIGRKGAMYPLYRSSVPVSVLRESDNDANCALCDCRVSVGPLGLHQPL